MGYELYGNIWIVLLEYQLIAEAIGYVNGLDDEMKL
jgi:hypothetical protein